MKITTEAHGAFPTLKSLAGGPRIAFVNSDDQANYLRASRASKDLLILAADDISEEAISSWLQALLKLPPALSYVSKLHLWRSSRSKGFPSAPMSYGDALAILSFFAELNAGGAEHLIISCEYGKSRSVTTASFIREHIQFATRGQAQSYPNLWVKKMLELARERNPSVVDLTDRDLAKIERYNRARIEFFKSLDDHGGTLHAKQVAEMLNITETAVVGQVNSDRLIGLVSSEHQEYLIPAFQFSGNEKIPHLEELLKALGEVSDVAACTWFLNEPHKDFGLPAQVLKDGASAEQLQILRRDANLYGTPVAS